MSKAIITKDDMALLKEASEVFSETCCVPGIDGEEVPAETIVPEAKEYISETIDDPRYGIHQGLRWSFRGWHKNGIKDALWVGLGGGWVYGTVVPRGAYRGSFVRRFNCTVASTASMRSPPAAMA